MAETTKLEITAQWQQVSTGACTIAADSTTATFSVYVGLSAPTDNTYINFVLTEPMNVNYDAPVWLKLAGKNRSNKELVTVMGDL